MSKRIILICDVQKNKHIRKLTDILGPTQGRCSQSPTEKSVDYGVRFDVRTGVAIFHTDKLTTAKLYKV